MELENQLFHRVKIILHQVVKGIHQFLAPGILPMQVDGNIKDIIVSRCGCVIFLNTPVIVLTKPPREQHPALLFFPVQIITNHEHRALLRCEKLLQDIRHGLRYPIVYRVRRIRLRLYIKCIDLGE